MSELFSYQIEGARWLASHRFRLLADEMGLGKTAQAIVAADIVGAKKILVICPAVARINWAREFERWSFFDRDLFVCSFEHATKYADVIREAGDWDLLVIDETHFLKSIEAQRSKKVLGVIARCCKRIWALSGTPAPNHIGELWPLLRTFGLPIHYDEFVERYCDFVDKGYGRKIVGTKRDKIPEIREKILSKVMLRRLKRDVLKDLPPIFTSTTVVEAGKVDVDFELERMAEKQRVQVEDALAFARDDHERMLILEGMAQSVSTLRRYSGLQKVEPVFELVRGELEAKLYEKIVIFAVHTDVVRLLCEKLADFGCVSITGETNQTSRQRAIDEFQTNPHVKIFVGNIIAAGTNITLTAAHHVILAEIDWVPGNNSQAMMRCHRIGQRNAVSVRFVSLNNPLDEKVTRTVERKSKELAEIFDTQTIARNAQSCNLPTNNAK